MTAILGEAIAVGAGVVAITGDAAVAGEATGDAAIVGLGLGRGVPDGRTLGDADAAGVALAATVEEAAGVALAATVEVAAGVALAATVEVVAGVGLAFATDGDGLEATGVGLAAGGAAVVATAGVA